MSGWSRHSCATLIRFNASRFCTERDAKSRSVRRCHPSPTTTGGFPSCTSTPTATPLQVQLPPSHLVHRICLQSSSFTTYVLAACLSLPLSLSPPPPDVVAVLPADSKDAGAAPPVPVAFADRPTAAPLASPTAVPPPAYSLPAAARAPRPDATRPAVVFAQNALPGTGTPVAATTTAGFQSYTCASTAIPPPTKPAAFQSFTVLLHPISASPPAHLLY